MRCLDVTVVQRLIALRGVRDLHLAKCGTGGHWPQEPEALAPALQWTPKGTVTGCRLLFTGRSEPLRYFLSVAPSTTLVSLARLELPGRGRPRFQKHLVAPGFSSYQISHSQIACTSYQQHSRITAFE